MLWTPAWWGWNSGAYIFHPGYWGPHVGFYGGIAYGFGYTGFGYQGGYWSGGHVFYNRTVNNITNVNVSNVYNRTVVNSTVTRVSYNGGPGGVIARPSAAEQGFAREQHFAATGMQQRQVSKAHDDPHAFMHTNGGHPPRLAAMTPAPGAHSISGNRPPAGHAPPPEMRQQAMDAAPAAPPSTRQGQRLRRPATGSTRHNRCNSA
ncbi:MAG: hypothetical protein QM688_07870 [Sphingomonas bacterium]